MSERPNNLGVPIASTSDRAIQSGILQLKQPQLRTMGISEVIFRKILIFTFLTC